MVLGRHKHRCIMENGLSHNKVTNMLNNTTLILGEITNKVSFNTPCKGLIQKSHPKSNFERFHKSSKMAEWVFSDYPRLQEETYKADKIVVLQIMLCEDNDMLVEYVYEKDLGGENQ